MQRFKFIDFMVFELRKKQKIMKTWTKINVEIIFQILCTLVIFCTLAIFHTFFTFKVKSTSNMKVKMNKIGFQWG